MQSTGGLQDPHPWNQKDKRSLRKIDLYRDTIYIRTRRKSFLDDIRCRVDSVLTLANYQSLAELRYQIRRFLHFSEQISCMAGLEPHQHQLMLALKGLPTKVPPRIGQLAERLQIRDHSAVELVNSLTPKGEKVLRELSLHHRAELHMHGPALIAALRRAIQMGTRSNGVPARAASQTERKT